MRSLKSLFRLRMLLLSVAALAMAQTTGQKPDLKQDFKHASEHFQISPLRREGRLEFRAQKSPYEFEGKSVQSGQPPGIAPAAPAPAPSTLPAAVALPAPVVMEQRLADRILGAGLRGILFLALISIAARLAPKRVWVEVTDGGNIPLGILLSAIAIALGMVISAP